MMGKTMAAARLAMAAAACCLVLLSLSVGTAVAAGRTGRITVYWGQTASEGSLRKACESNLYSTVILSFLTRFGGGRYKLDLTGHSWSAVGPDVKYCQSKNSMPGNDETKPRNGTSRKSEPYSCRAYTS